MGTTQFYHPEGSTVEYPDGWVELERTFFQKQQNIFHWKHEQTGYKVGWSPMTGCLVCDPIGACIKTIGYGMKGDYPAAIQQGFKYLEEMVNGQS